MHLLRCRRRVRDIHLLALVLAVKDKWQVLSPLEGHLICLQFRNERRSWDYDFWLFFITLALNVASMVQASLGRVSLFQQDKDVRCSTDFAESQDLSQAWAWVRGEPKDGPF